MSTLDVYLVQRIIDYKNSARTDFFLYASIGAGLLAAFIWSGSLIYFFMTLFVTIANLCMIADYYDTIRNMQRIQSFLTSSGADSIYAIDSQEETEQLT